MEKFKDKHPENILIVLLGAIGDVVRAFPLVARVKQKWPNCKITWAVETASFGIVKECRFVDRVVEFKRKGGMPAFITFIRGIKEERYDLTLDLQRHFKSGLTSILSGSATRVGFSKKNSREGNYLFNNYRIDEVPYMSDKIDQYLKFCEILGLDENPEKLDFGLSEDIEIKIDLEKKLENFSVQNGSVNYPIEKRVLLFIGSTWESKIWPSKHFAELADRLNLDLGYLPILVGSKGEQPKAAEIISLCKSSVLNLVGETTLKEFKNLCLIAKFAVACDSGPMHIACAVKLPVVSIWGPTSPIRSRPYGNKKFVIQSPVGCRGCYQRVCPGLDTVCLDDIEPSVVLNMINLI